MNRPWLLRVASLGLRIPLYYRFYRAHATSRPELYQAAPLAAAPEVRLQLQPGDEMHDCIAYTGLYDAELTQRIQHCAHAGGLLVDVGANYGYYATLWAAAAPGNRVIAFEASPRNVAGLRHNVESNGFAERIRIEARAASREEGELVFDPGPAGQTGWGGAVLEEKAGVVRVPAVRLDHVLADEPRIDLLKIDVEGAEPWVLEGAAELFRGRRVKQVFFEVNKPRLAALGLAPNAGVDLLRNAGFEVEPIGDSQADVLDYSAVLRGA
jgi:FkbM family methyltransferase